jgi:hypothetical protein
LLEEFQKFVQNALIVQSSSESVVLGDGFSTNVKDDLFYFWNIQDMDFISEESFVKTKINKVSSSFRKAKEVKSYFPMSYVISPFLNLNLVLQLLQYIKFSKFSLIIILLQTKQATNI